MKKNIRILSMIMALMLIVSTSIISASAALAPARIGDVDDNDEISILDATYVQRHIAKLQELEQFACFVGDVDNNLKLTILDATLIQQFVAQKISEFPAGNWATIDLFSEALVSDYNFCAPVGTPVTFTAIATGYAKPFVYEFYINDEVVQEFSEQNTCVYTFDKSGTYEVKVSVRNRAGLEHGEVMRFTVNDAPATNNLYISSLYHKGFYDSYTTFEAVAKNGTEPYEYEFDICKLTKDEPVYGESIESQRYSQSNTFTLSKRLEDYSEYIVYATVRDANGNTDTKSITFTYMTPPPA